MTTVLKTDVCIVGAGPIGLTLSLALARRGQHVVVIEQNDTAEISDPKSNHVSARSMEIYRQLGVADAIRAAGLPDDYPNDGVYATKFTGYELVRFRMPSRRHRFDDDGYDDGNLPSPERAARVSQMYLVPILAEAVAAEPTASVVMGCTFERLEEQGDAVTIEARMSATDEKLRIESRYLIGADGGKSKVRHALGVRLTGDDNLLKSRSLLFRAPDLMSRCAYPPAWMHWLHTDPGWSCLITLDGKELWIIQNYMYADVEFEAVDLDKTIRRALGVPADFEYEPLRQQDWVGRRLIANRLKSGRCFLAGDAAHLWPPNGGFGMNSAIAGAACLAWMLDAVLTGWAPESLLDAYEAERRPVIEQTSHFAASLTEMLELDIAHVYDDSAAGEEARKRLGAVIEAQTREAMVPNGLNFGYSYPDSPIVLGDGEAPPPYTMGSYEPSTVPGCRLPHFWTAAGESIYDLLGHGYAAIRTDAGIDVDPLIEAAREHGVPLTVVDLLNQPVPLAHKDHPLILVRPDQHIAWRGRQCPDDCAQLINVIRGAREAHWREGEFRDAG